MPGADVTRRRPAPRYLVMRGVSLRAVQDLLGHKDIKMTMRYAHRPGRHPGRGRVARRAGHPGEEGAGGLRPGPQQGPARDPIS